MYIILFFYIGKSIFVLLPGSSGVQQSSMVISPLYNKVDFPTQIASEQISQQEVAQGYHQPYNHQPGLPLPHSSGIPETNSLKLKISKLL